MTRSSPVEDLPPLDDDGAVTDDPLVAAEGLRDFLSTAGSLTIDDRRTIVDQALVLIEQNYVHLPLKRAMHAVDPVQALELLRDRLAHATAHTMSSESAFHADLLEIFATMRDLHTNYLLPEPFASRVAFLPFQVEEYVEDGAPRYQVAHVVSGFTHATFQAGVEVTSWSGVPITRAIEVNADRHAGSNPAARHARGIQFLALRPLVQSLPPDEEWVEVGYVDLNGVSRSLRHEWSVFDVGDAESGVDPDQPSEAAAALGLDRELDVATTAKRIMFAGGSSRPAPAPRLTTDPAAPDTDVPTTLPTVLRARNVTTAHGSLGHLRIFSFNVSDPDAFVAEVERLIGLLPQTMLIVDVRGNGGGHIYASEGLLQLFTPRTITPEPTQFLVSQLNRRLCVRHEETPVGIDLSPWLPSIEQAVRTGAVYSSGHPITPTAFANSIGQRYPGRVACITDARCYSATDIFAAGFQDHAVGPIIGVDDNTGAGGANVWTHRLLQQLLQVPSPPDPGSPYESLPAGSAMRVSIRRTLRVHERAGTPLEDLGVEPDVRRDLTRNDLLNHNVDLVDFAAGTLAAMPLRVLDAVARDAVGDIRQVDVTVDNLDRLDVFIDGRPGASLDVSTGDIVIEVPASARAVRLSGWSESEIVVSKLVDISPSRLDIGVDDDDTIDKFSNHHGKRLLVAAEQSVPSLGELPPQDSDGPQPKWCRHARR
jgi:hypothetical protein